ncbi:hypothetical protein LINPERHAP1_LOCUS5969 [Linum perenne]
MAYMLKLAFVSSQQQNLLWVRVLLGKYLRESGGAFYPTHKASQSNI